jgi:hypothetical protein
MHTRDQHQNEKTCPPFPRLTLLSLFGWLVADGWCWFLLREEYCWLVASGWFVVREKYCWLVADKPNEQGDMNMDMTPRKRKGTTSPVTLRLCYQLVSCLWPWWV